MAILMLLLAAPVLAGAQFLFKTKKAGMAAAVIYAAIHLAGSIYLFFNPQPFGPYFAAEPVNCVFLLILSVVFAGVSFYSADFLERSNAGLLKSGYYTAALLGFTASMTGVILSSNLGMMWVFLEATTLAGAYLVYFKGGKHALEAAWKYIFICSIGIAFAFVGIILLSMSSSGMSGGLSFAWLGANAPHFDKFWLKLAFVFMAIGFGTKAGLAPVHAWLPDAHSEAPSPVSALLSAALLNCAMLALIRVFSVMREAGLERFASAYLILMGSLSVFVGAVYMIRVGNYKRMLAYSSIENMGVIAIAIALGRQAFPIVLIQAAGHSLSKAAFFLTSGNILRRYDAKEISSVTGLFTADRYTAWLWIFSFIMIAGIPPSPLFIGEFLLIRELIMRMMWPEAVLLLVLMTVVIYGMASAVIKMCSGQAPPNAGADKLGPARYAPQTAFLVLLTALTVFLCAIWR